MGRDLRGRAVLVTGGAGFIGSHTVDALVAQGARVIVIDNFLTGRKENLNPLATFYEVNIRDDRVEEIVAREQPEIVYHFAHFVLVPKSVENPLLDLDAIEGSIRLLRASKEVGVRKVVLGSSGFLYGNRAPLPAGERCPVDPVSPYVVAKQAIESYVRFFRSAYHLPYTILRYAAVYGPRQVTGAMADYIRKLASGTQAEIWGDGSKTRDYVFIEDVVRANLLALDVPDDHPDPVFNIGTGTETMLNEVYRSIARLLRREARPIYLPDRPGEQMRYWLDISKARHELGWEPQWSVELGLAATVTAAVGSRT